ncbi:MAG: ribonuclease P protein component [Deltaproteobacteria bacterium]|nr:ribonuclease P protein component [Deltaproteobacteria bacterium]
MRFCFTKADRILKRSEFLKLSILGEKTQNRHYIVMFFPGRSQRTRLGVTVAKKVGNAPTRNRIKRFSREFFRLNRHIITGHWDINIIAKKRAADLSSEQAFLSLKDVIKNISRSLEH